MNSSYIILKGTAMAAYKCLMNRYFYCSSDASNCLNGADAFLSHL